MDSNYFKITRCTKCANQENVLYVWNSVTSPHDYFEDKKVVSYKIYMCRYDDRFYLGFNPAII